MVVSSPKPLSIAVLTISDSRNEKTDSSGQFLADILVDAGHHLHEKVIAKDDIPSIQAVVKDWINDRSVNAIITTGGTGFYSARCHPRGHQPII
jgi:molybdenum cofactor biosynthesis protein B